MKLIEGISASEKGACACDGTAFHTRAPQLPTPTSPSLFQLKACGGGNFQSLLLHSRFLCFPRRTVLCTPRQAFSKYPDRSLSLPSRNAGFASPHSLCERRYPAPPPPYHATSHACQPRRFNVLSPPPPPWKWQNGGAPEFLW